MYICKIFDIETNYLMGLIIISAILLCPTLPQRARELISRSAQTHDRFPPFKFRGYRKILFLENFNESAVVEPQVGIDFQLVADKRADVGRVVGFQIWVDVRIVRLDDSGKGHGVLQIVMAGIYDRISGKGR